MNGHRFFRTAMMAFFCLTLCLLCACPPDDDDDSSDDDDDNDDDDTGDDDDDTDDDDNDADDDDDASPICPEIVDGGRAGKDGSWAALDSAGRTLVVTTKAKELVVFTSADGLTWTMEHIVGCCEGFQPQNPQIALAGDNTPHIVFRDENSETLVHVWRDAENWEYESLNDYQCTGDFSLAVDADDAAHLAYYADDGFYYATNRNGAWVNETLLSSSFQLRNTRLALDANGNPRVAYLNSERAVVLATRTAKGWSQQTMDEQPHMAVTLGIDADGHNHLIASTHLDERNYVHYFHDLTGAWSEYTLTDVSYGDLSPIVFADGKLHFSVIHSSIFLYVAWLLFELDTDGTIEWITGIDSAQSFKTAWTRSADGVIHCLYTADYPNEDFLDLTNINGDWESRVADRTVTPTDPLAQTIDALGATHLLYFVDSDNRFNHAQRQEAGWDRQSLTDELLPYKLDLIAGADGKPTAAFIQDNQPVVAVYDGGAWNYTTVETTAQASDLTLALDNEGRLHLALCDASNDLLLVLRQEGKSWTQQLSQNIDCRYPRLLFDQNDAAHLWYVKNLNAYYVADALDSWHPNIVHAGAHPTARPLLTSDGQVHLLIIGDGALRHFAGPPGNLQGEELVVLTDNMGFSPGFAADADDTLYVTVRQDDHLALQTGTFGDWQTVTFPEWGEVDIYSTINVDADGNCRLAWLADGVLWFTTMPCP